MVRWLLALTGRGRDALFTYVDVRSLRGCTALSMAAEEGDAECVGLLLRARASVDMADDVGATPLLRACFNGHEEAVDVLIACDGFRRMLPAPNLLATCKVRVRTGYDLKMIGGQQQRLDLLIDEVLELMATKGGERGLRLIKSYIPTFVWPKPPGAKPRR